MKNSSTDAATIATIANALELASARKRQAILDQGLDARYGETATREGLEKESGLRRNISIDMIDNMSINELAALGPDVLADLQDGVDLELAAARKRQAILDQALDSRYSLTVTATRERLEKESGIVRIPDGDCTIVADAKKAVYWDNEIMTDIKKRITDAGDDPDKYMTTKVDLSVPEALYKNWPEEIRKAFMAARTVKHGKQSYKIERKKLVF